MRYRASWNVGVAKLALAEADRSSGASDGHDLTTAGPRMRLSGPMLVDSWESWRRSCGNVLHLDLRSAGVGEWAVVGRSLSARS
jgi:hypothetical protein